MILNKNIIITKFKTLFEEVSAENKFSDETVLGINLKDINLDLTVIFGPSIINWIVYSGDSLQFSLRTDYSYGSLDKIVIYIRQLLIAERTWESIRDTDFHHRWLLTIEEIIELTKTNEILWEKQHSGDYVANFNGWDLILSEDTLCLQYPKQQPLFVTDGFKLEPLHKTITEREQNG
jgi:hypothetical protein